MSTAFNPLDPQNAPADADHDGQSNLAEFLAGTNPMNQLSVFSIVSVEAEPSPGLRPPSPIGWERDGVREVRLRWSSGSNQFYTVEQSPQDFFPTFTPLRSSFRATPPVNTFTNTAPGDTSHFHRLRLQPWPTQWP